LRVHKDYQLEPSKWMVRLGISAVIQMLIRYTIICYSLIDRGSIVRSGKEDTGKDQQLTKLTDHDILQYEGSYSELSSSWGLGISVKSEELPERAIIEWQADAGTLRSWNAKMKIPDEINDSNKIIGCRMI
jgi:hypothetical protein